MALRSLCAGLLLTACRIADAPPANGVVQSAVPQSATPPPLRIVQMDVGQADAALIVTPEGKRILVDAGRNSDALSSRLRREGIDTLDLVIASHNHEDHIGGMVNVFRSTVVRAYLENGIPHTTATYRGTLASVEREPGLQYLKATERTITLGSVRVRVLGLPGVDSGQNNNSVGVIVEYGKFSALYTGDSEIPELSSWLEAGKLPRVTVVKVAHHGSWNGTNAELVRTTSPAIALISVAASNRYGHPSPQIVQMWLRSGARVYRTDRDGDVEILAKTDGTFTVRTSRAVAGRGR